MRDAGEPVPTIAAALKVSESTVYRAVRDCPPRKQGPKHLPNGTLTWLLALICDNPNTIRGDVSKMTQPSREPGWYPDPSDPSKNIYWDGSAWQGSPTSVEADESGSSKKIGIAIAVIVLGLVGTVMAQQSVSLISGTGQIWTGVAIAGVALALSYFLGAAFWVRIIASTCLVFSLFSAVYMETQLSEKRQELRQIFNS